MSDLPSSAMVLIAPVNAPDGFAEHGHAQIVGARVLNPGRIAPQMLRVNPMGPACSLRPEKVAILPATIKVALSMPPQLVCVTPGLPV